MLGLQHDGTLRVVSEGAHVFSEEDGVLDLALSARIEYDRWGLVKGLVGHLDEL